MGALIKADEMRRNGDTGSIVTLLCDSGERYLDTYYNCEWVNTHIGCLAQAQATLAKLIEQQ